jgi:hypothetical protein
MDFTGTPGNDNLTGTSGADLFEMDQKGNDTIDAGGGDDRIEFGGRFSELDTVNGGAGNDTLVLDGDYSDGLDLKPTTLTSIETIDLFGTLPVTLIMKDKNVAAGDTLTINANALAGQPDPSTSLYLDLSAETDGFYHVIGTDGNDEFHLGAALKASDHIAGGGGDDQLYLDGDYNMRLSARTLTRITTLNMDATHNYRFVASDGTVAPGSFMRVNGTADAGKTDDFNARAEMGSAYEFVTSSNGGTVIFTGGRGNDAFNGDLTVQDRLDGGLGINVFGWTSLAPSMHTLHLHNQLTRIETVVYSVSQDLHLVTSHAIEDPGGTLVFDARPSDSVLNFNDSHDLTGMLDFINGALTTATVVGTGQDDTFNLTQGGRATITGGGGADLFVAASAKLERFVYAAVSDSTSTEHDTITHADFANERFITHFVGASVSGVDTAVTAGTLSTATFDSDLASAVGAGQMGAHHAVLFTANAGTLSGHTFLVVDENGTAGYQASADLVIDVTGATGTLSTLNFA